MKISNCFSLILIAVFFMNISSIQAQSNAARQVIVAIDTDADGITNESDRDDDGDGLIEIHNLDELDDIRHHLDGTAQYGDSTGCPAAGCNGFELTTDLDFDSDDTGSYGLWIPLGTYSYENFQFDASPFTAIFDGNGYEIRNLRVADLPTGFIAFQGIGGLFAALDGAIIRNLGLTGSSGLISVTGK